MNTLAKCPEVVGGNTNTPPTSKRYREFPSFVSYLDTEPHFDENVMKYLIYGRELCPSTKDYPDDKKKYHWQGYVYFFDKYSFKKAQKLLKIGDSHIEWILKDTTHSAINYCKKDGDYKEFGNPPCQGRRADLDSIKNEILNGTKVDEICLDRPMMYHQYGRTLNRIEELYLQKQFRTEMTKGIWYYGRSGVGKSDKWSIGFNPETHYKHNLECEWWDRYKGQEICIFDEFRGQLKFSELLSLCDRHPHYVKRRGREDIPFLSKTIIITSALRPEEVFSCLDANDKMEQFNRRFEVILVEKNKSCLLF